MRPFGISSSETVESSMTLTLGPIVNLLLPLNGNSARGVECARFGKVPKRACAELRSSEETGDP